MFKTWEENLHSQNNLSVDLESKRLKFQKFQLDYYQEIYKNWTSDTRVTKYLSWDAHSNTTETYDYLLSKIKTYQLNPFNLSWAIIEKTSNKIIGEISLHKIDLQHKTCEIGYVLSYHYWNKGYMTESLTTIKKYLFENLGFKKLEILHHLDNLASEKVILKNGFTYCETNKLLVKNEEQHHKKYFILNKLK